MAWWEWIPIVSTVGHAMADPPGRKVSDYADCAPTEKDCEGYGTDAAVFRCRDCITKKMRQYVYDWIFSGAPSDIVETIFADTLGKFVESLGKVLAKKFGPRFAVAGTGAGAVFAIDGALDLGIQIIKATEMWEAANEAQKLYCKCE